MLRKKIKSKKIFLIFLSVGLVLPNVGVFFKPVCAQTWVEGHITQDTTWTIAESPYRVIGDITVYEGVTLTIEPGVKVEFTSSLIVDGSLNAIGVKGTIINFTSSRVDPFPGAWGGIQFIGSKDESFMISFCEFSYASHGITIDNSHTSLGRVTIENSHFRDCAESGVYMYTSVETNTTIKGNYFTRTKYGIFATTDPSIGPGLSGLNIEDNTIYDIDQDGIYMESAVKIERITVKDNEIRLIGSNGIHFETFNAREGRFSYISVHNNSVIAARTGLRIWCAAGAWGYTPTLDYDIIVSKNTFRNGGVGIDIYLVKTNITYNRIYYNDYGIKYYKTYWGSLAKFNDIYENFDYGIYVNNSKVKAEQNYWGDSSGPYHESINPQGRGNSVNGNGVDLDFIPFLPAPVPSLNSPPVAVLEVDKTNPIVDETVTFDASDSTDDGRIDYYFFDFGDGKNSGWTPLSVVTHKYASEGTYNATLIVMDDFGVTSLDGDLVYVEITVIPEFPASLILPFFMILTSITVILGKRMKISHKE